MDKLTFYIVDVFAPEIYAGNQLAVFRDAGGLTGDEMQKLAKEMNYSETTFILSDSERDGGYDVRIFTPDREIPFAGHPTLGTAYVIQREIIGRPAEEVALNLLHFLTDFLGVEILEALRDPDNRYRLIFDLDRDGQVVFIQNLQTAFDRDDILLMWRQSVLNQVSAEPITLKESPAQ